MTFNVLAQAEDVSRRACRLVDRRMQLTSTRFHSPSQIHIGAWPYTPDFNTSESLWFESAEGE